MDIIDPTTLRNCDDLFLDHPSASIFHTSAWARVLKEAYGYRPCYFVERKNGSVQTLIPMMEVNSFITGRRGVSLPFSDYCPPLLTDGAPLDDKLPELVKHGSSSTWKTFELRGGCLSSAEPSSQYHIYTLDLTAGVETLYKKVKHNVSQNLARSQKEGLTVDFAHSSGALQEFIPLNCLTRKRHGLPPQPDSFFKRFYDHIISKELGTIGLTRYKGITIAAGVFLEFQQKVFFKYSGSNFAYQNMRPMNILYWRAIEWYCSKNYKELCLGRTELENEGLIRFKNAWSPSHSMLNYYRFHLASNCFVRDKSKLAGVHNHFFRSLPMPLLKIAGSILYRHMG